MMGKRYYSEEDTKVGVTPSRLKKLSKAKQAQYLVWWFQSMFEDPAHDTPYNGREGGYLYILGGPYAADDELYKEFGLIISDEVIERAANEITSDGIFDWAPGHNHPDRLHAAQEAQSDVDDNRNELDVIKRHIEAGEIFSYGGALELRKRQDIIRELEKLRGLLKASPREYGGIGHNRPPEQHNLETESNRIQKAATIVTQELSKDAPNAKAIVDAAGVFRSALDSFASSFGSTLGTTAAIAVATYAVPTITRIFTMIVEWLSCAAFF